MSDPQAILECPACGSRNKPTWEFCVRCGESLQTAEGAVTAAVAAEASVPTEAEVVPAAGDGPSLWTFVAAGVALMAGIAVWQSGWAKKDPPKPSPATFALVVQDAQPPAPPPYRSPSLKFIQAQQRLNAGDVAGAIALLEEVIGEEPDNVEFHRVHAQALLRAERVDEAIAAAKIAHGLAPSAFLARLLSIAGRSQDALVEYEALMAGPGSSSESVGREYAALLDQTGQHARAAEVLKRLVQEHPKNLNLQRALGSALEQAGDAASAIDVDRRLVAQDPTDLPARLRLAELVARQGALEDAIQLYREGVSQHPEIGTLHRRLGELLEKSGNLQEAADHYREFSRLDPTAPAADGFAKRAAALEARGQRS